MHKRILIPLALILMLALAACSGQTAEPTVMEVAPQSQEVAEAGEEAMAEESMDDAEMMDDEAMEADDDDDMIAESMDDAEMMEDDHDDAMEASDDEAMAGEGMDDDSAVSEAEDMAMADLPVWQTIALTNAATGETFTLADFQGKTVFVEPMATWCTNCRQQQGQVREAKAQLSADDVVFVGLSLETSLPHGDLAQYARDNGFDWTYAVMSVELLEGLANEFGRSITSAPSTPHFIIRPDGSFTELSTGIDPASEIVAMIQAAQS